MAGSLRTWPVTGRAFIRARAPRLLRGMFAFSVVLVMLCGLSFAQAIPGLGAESPLIASMLSAAEDEDSAALSNPAALDSDSDDAVQAFGDERDSSGTTVSANPDQASGAAGKDDAESASSEGKSEGDSRGDGDDEAADAESDAESDASSSPGRAPAVPASPSSPSSAVPSSSGASSEPEPEEASDPEPEVDPEAERDRIKRIGLYGEALTDEEIAAIDNAFPAILDEECAKLQALGDHALEIYRFCPTFDHRTQTWPYEDPAPMSDVMTSAWEEADARLRSHGYPNGEIPAPYQIRYDYFYSSFLQLICFYGELDQKYNELCSQPPDADPYQYMYAYNPSLCMTDYQEYSVRMWG
ncbi:hypothetical protein [Adlercreutzia aquisgranensis]|uniref:hypothetical protein n=1 Tax=Adlercreutzia aquisgranensis TaxID=2941323 RepID=UPI002041FA74|nr:hypothetical protein [Adlercreutzia aquisgranensis]